MPLSPGSRFGSFEVVSLLGAGGMGEVYRARDPRLNREVALKVLPDTLAHDADRLARFTREAQTLASLNHPNIAAIHGLEDGGSRPALVLELVEGPTLADRIQQGPVPVDDALPIARQIAEALEAAHERGIVHRDLKPANVKVRPDGTVKVLDFGLAKYAGPPEGPHSSAGVGAGFSRPDVTASPTMLSPATMTAAGLVLGTAAYMAPEQARGKAVDHRADIWAFGCVLYEMLAGRRIFDPSTGSGSSRAQSRDDGEEITDTLAAILRGEPDWSALPASTPRIVQRLLRRCLEKNPRERLQAIGDARIDIQEAMGAGGEGEVTTPLAPLARPPIVALATAVLLTAVVVGAATWMLKPSPAAPDATVTRSLISADAFEHRPPPKPGAVLQNFGHLDRTGVAFSPDGRTLVYRGNAFDVNPGGAFQSALFFRPLDSLTATPIRTTTGAENPFFSPDGQWVGYWDGGELRRVALQENAAYTTIAPVKDGDRILGASWGDGDLIVFATFDGLFRVPASGGTPERFSEIAPDENVRSLPHLLPGGRDVLFTRQKISFSWEDAEIVARSLATGEEKVLLTDAADARFLPGGHLVFMRRGKLMAAPFDPAGLEVRGGAVTIADNVMQAVNMGNSGRDSGAGQFAVSAQGSLVYVTGGIAPDSPREVVWVDRGGSVQPIVSGRTFAAPRLSPDGQRFAAFAGEPGASGNRVWIYDLARGTLTALTSDDELAFWSVWSPDGSQIAFESLQPGRGTLHVRSADGTGSARRLVDKSVFQAPSSWSADGTLVYSESNADTASDIWVLDAASATPAPRVIVNTPASERFPVLSPDGKWLAYASNQSGREEIYVQPYPGPGPRVLVSTAGGVAPAWRGDGRELYYTFGGADGNAMMAVPITIAGDRLTAGVPQQLFVGPFGSTGPSRGYDVTPDGRRFLMTRIIQPPPPPPSQMVLVTNVVEELKRPGPAR